LPDEQRVALRLRYEHGLRYAEIASVLGISPSAVEKRIARTLGTLRAWILR
jgi:RNA polymerase sigma factor (sigma-70 family)